MQLSITMQSFCRIDKFLTMEQFLTLDRSKRKAKRKYRNIRRKYILLKELYEAISLRERYLEKKLKDAHVRFAPSLLTERADC